MKYLILGANGLVGKAFVNILTDLGQDVYGCVRKPNSDDILECDILKYQDLKNVFSKIKPDIVINTANLAGGVNYCETHPKDAEDFHFIANKNIANLCKEYNSKLIFISTDYIFDGKNSPYKEEDKKNPLNIYGQMKLKAEEYLQNNLKDYLIIRTTNIYGWDPKTKTPNFLMQIYRKLINNEKVKVPSYLWGNPTYVDDLVRGIIDLCVNGHSGVYHIVGDSFINRYDWACALANKLNINVNLIEEQKESEINSVLRPFKSYLNTDKFKLNSSIKLNTCEHGLDLFNKEINPKVSVLMTVYNGEEFIKEAVDSILNQTFKDFEFLIIDNKSTDATVDIIKQYKDEHINLVVNEENIGQANALNKGLKLAKGEYIARLDADDISCPERLSKQVEFMEKNLDIGICGSWIETIGYDSGHIRKLPISPEEISVFLLFNNVIAHPSVMIRNNILRKNNLIYRSEFSPAEDYDLWERMSHITKIANIPQVLLKYRLPSKKVRESRDARKGNYANQISRRALSNLLQDSEADELLAILKSIDTSVGIALKQSIKLNKLFKKLKKQNKYKKLYLEPCFSRVLAYYLFQLYAIPYFLMSHFRKYLFFCLTRRCVI